MRATAGPDSSWATSDSCLVATGHGSLGLAVLMLNEPRMQAKPGAPRSGSNQDDGSVEGPGGTSKCARDSSQATSTAPHLKVDRQDQAQGRIP